MAKNVATTGNAGLALPEDLVVPPGAGLEDADRDSYAIPFLLILQKTSPKADPDHEAYMAEAKPGMLLDSVADELIDCDKDDVLIIPVYYRRAFIEWKTREDGGGFVGEHSVEEAAEMKWNRDDNGRDILENGNQIVDTRYHYVILVRGDSIQPMVITMASTQVKKSKKLNSDLDTQMRASGLRATFQTLYKVRTVGESNEHGTWRGWEIKRAGLVENADQFNAAIEFYKAIKSGEVKEATDSLDPAGEATEEGNPSF